MNWRDMVEELIQDLLNEEMNGLEVIERLRELLDKGESAPTLRQAIRKRFGQGS